MRLLQWVDHQRLHTVNKWPLKWWMQACKDTTGVLKWMQACKDTTGVLKWMQACKDTTGVLKWMQACKDTASVLKWMQACKDTASIQKVDCRRRRLGISADNELTIVTVVYCTVIYTFLPLGEECKDEWKDCKNTFFKNKKCWDPELKDQMEQNCAKTCGYCSKCPRCGLLIWLSLLAIFNTLFWVYANFFHEETDKILEVRHFRMIQNWPPTVTRQQRAWFKTHPITFQSVIRCQGLKPQVVVVYVVVVVVVSAVFLMSIGCWDRKSFPYGCCTKDNKIPAEGDDKKGCGSKWTANTADSTFMFLPGSLHPYVRVRVCTFACVL